MKNNRLCLVLATIALVLPVWSFAGGVSCTSTTGLVPDGRVLDFDNVQPGSTVYYSFASVTGRSYSIEVRDDVDSNPGGDLQIKYYSQTAQSAGWTCATAVAMTAGTAPNYTSTQYRDTTAIEPKLVSGQRVSLPAPANDTIIISVKNNGSNSHYLAVSVAETTMYSSMWESYGNLYDYYSLANTTSAPLTYTLSLVTTLCSPIAPATTCTPQTLTDTTTIGANTSVFRNSATAPLVLNAQQIGYAVLIHDGPPDALSIEAIIGNFGSMPYSTFTVPFVPRIHK